MAEQVLRVARPESAKGVLPEHALRGLRACHPARPALKLLPFPFGPIASALRGCFSERRFPMLRAIVCPVLVLVLLGAGPGASDKKGQKTFKAKITKVDLKKGQVTVLMKGKKGKPVKRTFTLTEDIRYLDSTGKMVNVSFFRSGDYVLMALEEGKIKQLKKDTNKKQASTDNKNTKARPREKRLKDK
jgi:hypothetical protein